MAPNEYSATVTPFRTNVCGLPISTFTATITSLVLYIISIILILATNCPMNPRVSYFIAFLVIAIVATCCMAAINMMYARYHFNCLSLSVSLLYSGSAALVTLGLFVTAINGLCVKKPPENNINVRSDADETDQILSPSNRQIIFKDYFQDCNSNQSLFTSGHVGSYFIWSLAAIADAFQIVAHYYYG